MAQDGWDLEGMEWGDGSKMDGTGDKGWVGTGGVGTGQALGKDELINSKNSGKLRENPSGKAFAPRIYIPPSPPPPHPGSHPPPRHFYISGFQELTFKSPQNQIRVWKPGANMFPLFFGTFIRSFPGIPKGKTLIGSVSTREFWLWGPFM